MSLHMDDNIGNEMVWYNGTEMRIKDIPDAATQHMMGYGHINPNGRPVMVVEGRTWETTPDVCTYGSLKWEWHTIGKSTFLLCPKCGLDGT